MFKLLTMASLVTTASADYLLTKTFSNATCNTGAMEFQMSTAVNLCQHNSYQPGTYQIECVNKPGTAHDECTTEQYTTADCTGPSVTQKKYDASGLCGAIQGSTYATFLIVADADAHKGFSTPLLTQWQDEDCTGTPVEYTDNGICHTLEGNSFKTACVNGTIQSCQYRSPGCSSTDMLCVPSAGNKPGACQARGMLGGKASVQLDC